MSDLISRQAAIDALHTKFRDGFDGDKWWNSTHVLAVIESLPPAQPEPQWIPCSERMPKVDESVLVTTEWNDISIAWRIGIDKWFIHEGNTNAMTDDLTAWMQLPEPYKGEQDD